MPALRRLLRLLICKEVIPAPAVPSATAAEQLQGEFRMYLQHERALASTTQDSYVGFVSHFLRERFGVGPVDLSGLCAADVTGFVRRRAITIQSIRVQLMTTALRSFKISALSGRHRQGSCCMCAGRRQLEAVDHSTRPSAVAGGACFEFHRPENCNGPPRLRDPLDLGPPRPSSW